MLRDTGDPDTTTPTPLQATDLDVLRLAVQQRVDLSTSEAAALLGHVDWLTDELERVAEQRDAYRDVAALSQFAGTPAGTHG
jgi:hypothetical protein